MAILVKLSFQCCSHHPVNPPLGCVAPSVPLNGPQPAYSPGFSSKMSYIGHENPICGESFGHLRGPHVLGQVRDPPGLRGATSPYKCQCLLGSSILRISEPQGTHGKLQLCTLLLWSYAFNGCRYWARALPHSNPAHRGYHYLFM